MGIGKILLIALVVLLVLFLIFYFVILNFMERCLFFSMLKWKLTGDSEPPKCSLDPKFDEYGQKIFDNGGNPLPTLSKLFDLERY